MTARRLERWSWTLIYVGLIAISLGWFIVPRGGPWGELLVASGLVSTAVGVFLIYLRSRMKDTPP